MKDESKTVRDIIESYLRDNGFDGLCEPDTECGCGLDDLAPCGGIIQDCHPAYRIRRPDGDPEEDDPFYTFDFDHKPTEAEVQKYWEKLRREEAE